jgi:prepilin-type N-terminal cleavage/methylation domain-containing protein
MADKDSSKERSRESMQLIRYRGFTLAELLISLAILGVIAAFTIPKILSSQQNGNYNAAAKEAASIISQAYSNYALNNTVDSNTRFADMTSYINYVAIDTTRTIDDKPTLTSLSCSLGAAGGCLVLHNGGVIRYNSSTLAGTASTNALEFYFDPNGTYGNTTDGPDKSLQMFVYYGGRVTTRGTAAANTVAAGFTYTSPNPSYDPSWFSW